MRLIIPLTKASSLNYDLGTAEVCIPEEPSKINKEIGFELNKLLEKTTVTVKADEFSRQILMSKMKVLGDECGESKKYRVVVGHVVDLPIVLEMVFFDSGEWAVCFYDMPGRMAVWVFATAFFNQVLKFGSFEDVPNTGFRKVLDNLGSKKPARA